MVQCQWSKTLVEHITQNNCLQRIFLVHFVGCHDRISLSFTLFFYDPLPNKKDRPASQRPTSDSQALAPLARVQLLQLSHPTY